MTIKSILSDKACAYCRELIPRSNPNFARAKYCNNTCRLNSLQSRLVSSSALRWRARKFIGELCEQCKTTDRLEVHHINRDKTDNSPINIITLCKSCHVKWHVERGHIKRKMLNDGKCKVCGIQTRYVKGSYNPFCGRHRARYERHGSPYYVNVRMGEKWVLIDERTGNTVNNCAQGSCGQCGWSGCS